jgi:hypothetical protein
MAEEKVVQLTERVGHAQRLRVPGPVECVWYAAKPGEARRFASPTEYSPDFARTLMNEGYTIIRIEFRMPVGWDSADNVVGGELRSIRTELPRPMDQP